MIKRIEKIMSEKNLSVGRFADLLEVQRSGMSHILSGRNNPSLHFVRRVLEVFPDINPKWLLFGEGDMYSNSNNEIRYSNNEITSLNAEKETEKADNHKIENKNANKETIVEQSEKKATKVIIFYSDNTFEISYSKK